ncbi:MAG: hypothetical protein M1830_005512, partial [Pleopsidium flavum]
MEYFNFEEAAGTHIEENCLNEIFDHNAISTHVEDNDIFIANLFEAAQSTSTPTIYLGRHTQLRYLRQRSGPHVPARETLRLLPRTESGMLYGSVRLIHQNDIYPDGFPGVFEEPTLHGGAPLGSQKLRPFPEPSLEERESISRKSGTRFSREAIRILKAWFAEHSHLPYPSEREKDELKTQTGLKRSQISNWLANARRRGKVRPARGASPAVGRSAAVDIPAHAGHLSIKDMSPMERWKHSPPENEPASVSAIANAVATTGYAPEYSSRSGSHGRSHQNSSNESSFSVFRAPSMSSLNTGRSSNSDLSFASAFSHRSQGSFGSLEQRGRRRRNKRAVTTVRSTNEVRGVRIFQCTFCTDSFPAKYDWQRHEKSLHLALEKWTCAPMGGVTQTTDGHMVCVFCNVPDPPPSHLETHNYTVCEEKTLLDRTFYRKDHLRQHLRLVHDCNFDPAMENWKSTSLNIRSCCGFCPKIFTTWQCRVDHLAAHFKAGADMSHWTGDWGFQPHVTRLIENAMPPYLIAQERESMDPFTGKATAYEANMLGATSDDRELRVLDANCYRRVARLLSIYVKELLKTGIVPSDKMLQDKARRTIFDDDDPWNQTSADNSQWLEIFKRENGLSDTLDANPVQMQDLNLHPPYV